MLFYITSLILSTFCCLPVHSCGIITHTEIGHRAARYFEYTDQYGTEYGKLIADHQDAFQAGNPYPDTFYDSLCKQGKFHDVSEDTHWAPFLNVTINYIRRTYPQPWDIETQKLVVFMLGFVSHQVADVSWHSLGIDQGFLATMGQINFFGSFSNAHTVGDVGGDVVSQFEFDTSYIGEVSEWYLPVQDLVAIYQEYYESSRVDASLIEECSALMFLGRLGEKLAMSKLFRSYASKSPYLIEEFQDYFLGGVDDMAVWTTNIWRASLFMLQNGTDNCQIPHSPLFISCPGQIDIDQKQTDIKTTSLHSRLHLHGLSLEDVNYRRTGRGVYISASSKLKRKLKMLQMKELIKDEKAKKKTSSSQKPLTTFYVKNEYAKLGWSFITEDLNGDGVLDLIIGAPGYTTTNNIQLGRVYIIYGSKKDGLPQGKINLDVSADANITGLQKNGRFGSALAVLDINLDGIADLVVSAPSVGSTSLSYYGEVYVYLGAKNGAFHTPNITIKGQNIENDYYNLGWTLSVGDVNRDGHDDLIIGSPFASAGGHQRGMVNVLYSDQKFKGNQVLSVIQMNITLNGDQDYGWFGNRIELKKMKSGQPLLLVSQPTYRICSYEGCPHSENDTQSVGRIIAYDVRRNFSDPVFCLHGVHSFDKLGSSLALGDPYHDGSDILALGVDTGNVTGKVLDIPSKFDQAGFIRLLNLTKLSIVNNGCHQTPVSSIPEVASFKGDRSYARFGMSTKLLDVTGDKIDDLIVSAPFRIEDITEELLGGDTGSVYVFKGGKSFGKGDVTIQCSGLASTVEPCPAEKAFRTFTTDERGSHFGKDIGVWKIQNSTALVVSAVGSNYGNRLSGALYLFTVK